METTFGEYTFRVTQDEDAFNPRTVFDNFAIMVFASYTHLGDKHEVDFSEGFDSRMDFIERGEKLVRKEYDAAVVLPVHLYKHSGVALSTEMTGNFACPWDSGTIGFVVVTKEAIRENWGIKRVLKKYVEHAQRIAEGEVETLSDYVGGQVYHFEVIKNEGKEDEEQIDSCGGYYGYDHEKSGLAESMFQGLELTEEQKKEILSEL